MDTSFLRCRRPVVMTSMNARAVHILAILLLSAITQLGHLSVFVRKTKIAPTKLMSAIIPYLTIAIQTQPVKTRILDLSASAGQVSMDMDGFALMSMNALRLCTGTCVGETPCAATVLVRILVPANRVSLETD